MAALFQLLLIALPALLLVTPRNLYGWTLAVLVLATTWLAWEIGRPLSMSEDWGALGRMLATGAILVWLAAYGLRALIDFIVSRKFPVDRIDYRPFRASLAIAGTFWCGWWFAAPLARWLGGWPVLLAGGVAAIFLLALGWRTDRGNWVFASIGATILVGIAAIWSWPPIVARAAEDRAAGQPYCIMIGDGDRDYRPARTMLDLSPLLMRATEVPSLRNQHALVILSAGGGLHFSYRGRLFERGFEGAEYVDHPLCTPQRDFARSLPIW